MYLNKDNTKFRLFFGLFLAISLIVSTGTVGFCVPISTSQTDTSTFSDVNFANEARLYSSVEANSLEENGCCVKCLSCQYCSSSFGIPFKGLHWQMGAGPSKFTLQANSTASVILQSLLRPPIHFAYDFN
jgi:hypothetical protein